ncbi:preprotein translocase subunit SecE [bacterium]|nr:preprotein translocase subunit SecE [bacterium]
MVNYFKNVKTELTKVTWPTRKEAMRLTVVVIAISLIFAALIGALDMLFSYLVRLVIESK